MKNKILKSKEEIKKELEEDYTIKKYKKKTYHDKYDILQQSKEFETIKKCNEKSVKYFINPHSIYFFFWHIQILFVK